MRSRPQRNAYHRFTVDRHLWEAAANAAELVDRVDRPDLLVLGALFHDIGKGYPGDHTEAGMELVARASAPRIGLAADDVATLVPLVQHHLLLPDVAVRRDLADPATIRRGRRRGRRRLDARPAARPHRGRLAGHRTVGVGRRGRRSSSPISSPAPRTPARRRGAGRRRTGRFPDAETLSAMAAGRIDVRLEADDAGGRRPGDQRVTVVCHDVPGAFARVAGVLSLHGLDVLTARAHSGEPRRAADGRVAVPRAAATAAASTGSRCVADLRRALAGELAIEARLAERARTYRRRRRRRRRAEPGPPSVRSTTTRRATRR